MVKRQIWEGVLIKVYKGMMKRMSRRIPEGLGLRLKV